MLKPLPPSDDKYWEHSDKHSVHVSDIKELLCEEHVFKLDKSSRELHCTNCPFGTRYTPTTIDIDEENKTIKMGDKLHKFIF